MFDYNSRRWKKKRKEILRRDGYLCQLCKRYGKQTEAVTVHHIKHADEYPELAFSDDNLVSLCNACHNKQHPEKAGSTKNTNPPHPTRLPGRKRIEVVYVGARGRNQTTRCRSSSQQHTNPSTG